MENISGRFDKGNLVMDKILIVGGAGYIGGFLTDILKTKDATVYDSLIYESRYLKQVNFIYGDIRDKEKLLRIMSNYNIVIWLAAVVGDGACAIDPYLTQSINEDCVKWFVDNYKGKFIYTSTCSVYGVNDDLLDETAPTNPISVYAKTKLAAEQYIINNHENYLIFRLGTLFGIGDEHSRIRFDLVVNVLTKKACTKQPLFVYGGEQWRPLLHVKDVSTAIQFGIDNHITGLFNLSCGNYTILNIAEEIRSHFPEARINYQDIPYEDLRNYKVKADKYLTLGWTPQHSLEEGILEIKDVVSQNRLKNIDDVVYSNEVYLNTKLFRL